MSEGSRRRKPNAVLGFLKAALVLLALLFLLPAWLIRGAVARARFRAELRAARVPLEAARSLSNRLKLSLKDLDGLRQARIT